MRATQRILCTLVLPGLRLAPEQGECLLSTKICASDFVSGWMAPLVEDSGRALPRRRKTMSILSLNLTLEC